MSTWKRFAIACVSLLAMGLAPIGVALAQVRVTAATPASAYQGTIALDVVVSGSGFNNSAKVQYFVSGTTNPGGITVRNVRFSSSSELVTTIDVADTADLASFDIVVTLDSGRKGKGTTLFSVKQKPNATVTPTYPTGRWRHAFAANSGTTSATSRLYMFGGTITNSDGTTSDVADLWAYSNAGSTGAAWTFIPGGTTAPSVRHGMGWSCGGGQCLMVNGIRGAGRVKETWVFSESTQTWSQVSCGRRVVCPSERSFPAMAFDPSRGIHVMFGGEDATTYQAVADTFLFNPATQTWRQASGGITPAARSWAAAVFVPGVGVVMFGGIANPCCINYLNDMNIWDGAAWLPVTSMVSGDPARPVPAMYGHSMAWDAGRSAVIVAGGQVTSWGKPSNETWYVALSKSATGAWQALWILASGIGCQASAGSPPDAVVHAGAQMAYDSVDGVQVFFGGFDPYDASTLYGNTVECR